ncbi:unnamed protein product [Allacma fusca]|uniref:Uncharacterized protein n=1 Tax=Allacma fusca TaxID=39272 RepID=A0A8J2LCL9_9HEXA|nr:unnamed protein product [Allacma fusca]
MPINRTPPRQNQPLITSFTTPSTAKQRREDEGETPHNTNPKASSMNYEIIKQLLRKLGCKIKKEIQESQSRITTQIEWRISELQARCDELEQKNLVQEKSIAELQLANQHICQEIKNKNVYIGGIPESKEEKTLTRQHDDGIAQ